MPAADDLVEAPAPAPTADGPGARARRQLAPADLAARLGRRLGRYLRGTLTRAALCSALLSALVFCLGGMMAGSYPFGSRTRNTVDYGTQYLPFHAYWRQVLTGGGEGDLLFNWKSGFGTNFLGDIGTYLASPFDLLVVFFPADRPELALYVVITVKIAAAGAAMTALLLRLRRGPWPVAAVLGAAYAVCGWTMDNGAVVPMWLDGLIAFPLLCLVGEWAIASRRPVAAPLVVAVAWIANFYTAYMATIGAAVFLLVRLFTAEGRTGARERRRALGNATRAVLIGIGLAAPLVLVVYQATKAASPTPDITFVAAKWPTIAARLMPATYSTVAPALYIGTPTLALALTLPFNRSVGIRERVGWPAAAVLVALSMNLTPTHLAWHAGAEPNGMPYRQAFVLAGLLVLAAWLSVAGGLPRVRAVLGGVAALAVLVFAGHGRKPLDSWSYALFAVALSVGALAAAAVLVHRRYGVGARLLPGVAVGLLLLSQGGEAAVSGMRVDERRLEVVSWEPRLGPAEQHAAEAVAERDDWPATRTDPGELPIGNAQMIAGGQGAEYYSSLTPETTVQMLVSLGFGFYGKGRHPESLDNPVTDAVFDIGTRVHSRPLRKTDPSTPALDSGTKVLINRTFGLVTVRPSGVGSDQLDTDDAFHAQEQLLGADVYDTPPTKVTTTPTKDLKTSGADGATEVATEYTTDVTTTCAPGSAVYLSAPDVDGNAALAGRKRVHLNGHPPAVRAPMALLGTVPTSGAVHVTLTSFGRPDLPAKPLGCLVKSRLDAAVSDRAAHAATSVHVGGHSLSAELPKGSKGMAVVAVPALDGWRCAAGDAPKRPARSDGGLIAVPLDGTATSLSCTFTPPGMKSGLAVGAAALVALVLTGLWYRRVRLRSAA